MYHEIVAAIVTACSQLLVRVTGEHLMTEVFHWKLQTVVILKIIVPTYHTLLLNGTHILRDHLRVLATDAARPHLQRMLLIQVLLLVMVVTAVPTIGYPLMLRIMVGISVHLSAH